MSGWTHTTASSQHSQDSFSKENMQTNNNDRRNDNRKREAVTYTDYNIFKGNVRLVGEGEKPMVMDRDDAIELAKSRGMNLVQIAYNKADSPRSTCRIMDYSKFKYDQKKREKEAKRRQRESMCEVKEIKFSLRIDDGDRNTKLRKVRELLENGDKVKLTVRLIRREMAHVDLALETMNGILLELADVAEVDQRTSFEGNTLSYTVKRKK